MECRLIQILHYIHSCKTSCFTGPEGTSILYGRHLNDGKTTCFTFKDYPSEMKDNW